MNLEEYEKKCFSIYKAFAEMVGFILQEALRSATDLPQPQSIQCRAKDVTSLRDRLAEENNLDTKTLELDRRDLAGARLIFYTNNDVERFIGSSLIRDNFNVEEASTRVHHPTPENEDTQYRGIHYTVRFREDRACLPEYAKFSGLRCEIQVQTILNHAWSETSHDILYKDRLGDGEYGRRAMEGIKRRFERIMAKYLIPAGYEMQKAQQDYERLLQGKELYDKDIAKLLGSAANNNERHELLTALKDYALQNYDDLSAAFEELKAPLLRVVLDARHTAPVPIDTTYGQMNGFKADAVTRIAVEIIESLRYVDVTGTLQLLIDIYRDEPNEDIRKKILGAVKNLSEYNIDAYKEVGPMLQMALVDYLAGISDAEVDNSIRPIALTVWTEAIQSDITGTRWTADAVTLSTVAVPTSKQLEEVRDKAISALLAAYDRSTDDAQKLAVLSALDAATRVPYRGQYSNQLLATTLKDAKRIIDFVTERTDSTSYELLQHLEHQFLFYFQRARGLINNPGNQFGCQTEAQELMDAITNFRDIINADNRFVRYKVLVGYKSVYPDHWTEEGLGPQAVEEYRNAEADRYIDGINAENAWEWFDLISRCAETKSSDLATFPVFGNFICNLSERKPDIADRFLADASGDLRNFLHGFLNGLAQSDRCDLYEKNLEHELESATNLSNIAFHLRRSGVEKPEFIPRLLSRAIEVDDSIAVIECLIFTIEHYGTGRVADADTLLCEALTFLNDRQDSRWVSGAWFLKNVTRFYEELTPDRTEQILQNLGYLQRIDYEAEHILVQLAEHQPEAVWDYFGSRMVREATEGEDEDRFEAVPFQLHGLEQELSKDPQLAIRKGLAWFAQDSRLFRFRGGRLLSNVFPHCTPNFAAALAELVRSGGDTEIDFALEILQNYEGEVSTYIILKEIVSRAPDDNSKTTRVKIAIDNTGVVSGALGYAEALRTRRESLSEWLTDGRQTVRDFAERHIEELSIEIAAEHRRVEAGREMLLRRFDEDSDVDGDDDKRGS